MSNSNALAPSEQPQAPAVRQRHKQEKFPLTKRADGRYCKKIRGAMHYFTGTRDDALAEWNRVKDDLLNGRAPQPKPDTENAVTLQYLCNRYLTDKADERDEGGISPVTWIGYERLCKRLVKEIGAGRAAASLGPDDFRAFRRSLGKTCGMNTLLPVIVQVRGIFNFAVKERLIDRLPQYGTAFELPKKKQRRTYRQRQEAEHGKKMFEAAELWKLIDAADVHMRAMTLLAVNAGYGNSDVGKLLLRSIDLKGGWVEQPRSKTGIERKAKLWPETIKAIRESLSKRPKPKLHEDEKYAFVTKYGAPWAKDTHDNPVAKAFAKLVKATKLEQTGRGFYSLRHTYRTIAKRARDLEATRYTMGHASGHVETDYDHEPVENERLAAVAAVVRNWLLAAKPKGRKRGAK